MASLRIKRKLRDFEGFLFRRQAAKWSQKRKQVATKDVTTCFDYCIFFKFAGSLIWAWEADTLPLSYSRKSGAGDGI